MARSTDTLIWMLFAAASVVLAWHPVVWLVQTWTAPAYDSTGFVFVIAVGLLALRSVLSGPAEGPAPKLVLPLLLAAAGLRFLSQTLAINLIGGLALAVDVYALALLLGVDRRPKAVAPLWLAGLFLFSLPVEAVLERLVGYPLQMASAELSCGIIGLFYADTLCEGVRITVQGVDVLVDLPCSGATGLLLLLAFFTGLSAVLRPRLHVAVLWGLATLGFALVGNSVRIALLAGGLVHGVDVMAEPLHSLIGLATLALSALPLVLFYRPLPVSRSRSGSPQSGVPLSAWVRMPAATASVLLAVWIVGQPAQPVDVSRPVSPVPLPAQIAGEIGREVPMTEFEQVYFAAYGGDAAKVQYGPLGLNRVSTTSPLRHLHAPEVCLRGLGYEVAFLGTRFEDTPSSVYRATAPDGAAWLVHVTYMSDEGHVTASIGEAVWHWMNGRGHTWSSVQRITPEGLDEPTRAAMDAGARAALDFPINNKEPVS